MRSFRRRLLWEVCAFLIAMPCGSAPRADEPSAKSPPATTIQSAAKKAKTKITISKEITYFLGPLREDGTVDYVAALNAISSKGVTPDNNAAVLLWKAIGPEGITPKCRAQFFKALGIPPLQDAGGYYVPLDLSIRKAALAALPPASEDEIAEYQSKADKDFEESCNRPWSQQEFPRIAAWLDANHRPIELMIEVTHRSRFYSPLWADPDHDQLFGMYHPELLSASHRVGELFELRAMLDLKSGKVDAALQEALACHRFARLYGQGPFLVDSLVAYALDEAACSMDEKIAEFGKLSSGQVQEFHKALRELPPAPQLSQVYGTGERAFGLDQIRLFANGDLGCFLNELLKLPLRDNEKSAYRNRASEIVDFASKQGVDWDFMLRNTNAEYDRLVEACSKRGYRERHTALAAINAEIRAKCDHFEKGKAVIETPKDAARELCDLLSCLNVVSKTAMVDAEERKNVRFEMAKLALALAAYRDENDGKYPAKLAELAPKYIAAVPKDPFAEEDLRYKPSDKGYLLYSVGPNGKDDGGREISDPSDPPGDDIAVRVPRSDK